MWYNITMSKSDSFGSEGKELFSGFENIFMLLGMPENFSLFAPKNLLVDPRQYYIFVSEYNQDYVDNLLKKYKGRKCEKPEHSDIIPLIGNFTLPE